ncbi:MAG: hypothetical protein ACPGO3_00370 [Magnetospiraceae bacterium]
MKPIHFFKTGKHTSAEGVEISFGENDLRRAAEVYDPSIHEAPIVIGHPVGDAPAYGWVGDVMFDDAGLHATPKEVDAQFEEMVAAGKFKKVSASFYTPEASANPVPGSLYLRHLGFLGAQPPAVKGLKPIEFSGGNEGVVTIEFADDADPSQENAGLVVRMLRDICSLLAGDVSPTFTEPADGGTPPEQEETPVSDPDDAAKKAELDTREADLAKRQQEQEVREAAFAERQAVAAAQADLSGLVKTGKVLPAEVEGLASFMAKLDDKEVISFAEGEDGKATPRAFFKGFLNGLPKRVDYSEVAAPDGGDGGKPSPQEVARKARDYVSDQRAKGNAVSYSEAVAHVTKEGEAQ